MGEGGGGWLAFKSKEIKDEDKTRKFNDAINNNFNTFSWPKKVEMLCKQKKFFPKNFFLSTKQGCVLKHEEREQAMRAIAKTQNVMFSILS